MVVLLSADYDGLEGRSIAIKGYILQNITKFEFVYHKHVHLMLKQ